MKTPANSARAREAEPPRHSTRTARRVEVSSRCAHLIHSDFARARSLSASRPLSRAPRTRDARFRRPPLVFFRACQAWEGRTPSAPRASLETRLETAKSKASQDGALRTVLCTAASEVLNRLAGQSGPSFRGDQQAVMERRLQRALRVLHRAVRRGQVARALGARCVDTAHRRGHHAHEHARRLTLHGRDDGAWRQELHGGAVAGGARSTRARRSRRRRRSHARCSRGARAALSYCYSWTTHVSGQ